MIRVACNADALGPRQPGDGRVEARMAPEPLYQRVNSPVTKKIISGELLPNQGMPLKHELVRAFGVFGMMANRALKELTSEGLLTRVPGVGTFVAQMHGK